MPTGTTVYGGNDGDLLEVRRAKAVAASLAHSTPTILPYEKLVMNKTKHLRGANSPSLGF